MFNRMFLLVGVAFLMTSGVSFAQNVTADDAVTYEESMAADFEANAYHWHYLGCVRYDDECRHRAHHEGYLAHFTEHNHDLCGHHDLACYGRRD